MKRFYTMGEATAAIVKEKGGKPITDKTLLDWFERDHIDLEPMRSITDRREYAIPGEVLRGVVVKRRRYKLRGPKELGAPRSHHPDPEKQVLKIKIAALEAELQAKKQAKLLADPPITEKTHIPVPTKPVARPLDPAVVSILPNLRPAPPTIHVPARSNLGSKDQQQTLKRWADYERVTTIMDLPSDLIWLADFTSEHHILSGTAIKHWHPQHHNSFFSVVTTLNDTGAEVLQKFKRGRSFGYAIDHDNAILALLLWLRRGLISLDVIAACKLRNCPCPHYGEWRDPDWRREHGIIERANALT